MQENKFMVKNSQNFGNLEKLRKNYLNNDKEEKKIKSNSNLQKNSSSIKKERFGFNTGRNWKKERITDLGKRFAFSGRKPAHYGSQSYRKSSRRRKNSKNLTSMDENKKTKEKINKRSNSFDQNAYVNFNFN